MEKYAYNVDRTEMERRWNVTLAAMEDQGIDCLILCASVGKLGGSMMYLTDFYAAGSYPHSAVFGKEGITLIAHGAKGGNVIPRNMELGNIAEQVGLPVTPSMTYANSFYPEEMVRVIRKHGHKRVGLVGMAYIPASIYNYLTETLDECQFVNASDMMDHIRAIKSEYELNMWKRCVSIHERVFAAIPSILRPGRSEWEIVQETEYVAKTLGCPYCSVMIGSDAVRPIKTPALFRSKILGDKNYVNFLLELSAPGGIWGELGRVFSLAEPSDAMLKAEKDSIELQQLIAENAKPGASPAELLALLNKNLEERGYCPESRIFAHSQGYDIVERPVFSQWETMCLEENMVLAIHPTCSNKDALCTNTDNFVVKPEGAIRISSISSGIFVIK